MTRGRARLASRLMAVQALIIAVGSTTLLVTAVLVAPGLFRQHLAMTGEDSPALRLHADQAFASSFAVAITAAMIVSLIAAGLVSLFLVRRISRPVEELARAAELVATGTYSVTVPTAAFSSELQQLSDSFSHMAHRLGETETTRARLLADLAHELRTPLATLMAYIDGLEDGVVEGSATSFDVMRDQVSRLRRLATDLRDAAAADEHGLNVLLVDLALADAAANAVSAAAPRFQAKNVSLDLGVNVPALLVTADRERLQQVLANLLDNALRHTAHNGKVTVRVERAAGHSGAIVVQDTGDGLPADQLDDIFERFHRVDSSRASADGSGSGLGLTIARAIISDLGGTLTASSPGPGRGSTFTVVIPLRGSLGNHAAGR